MKAAPDSRSDGTACCSHEEQAAAAPVGRGAACLVPRKSELLRFYAPIAFQAAAQALTYPLVAMVASRGPGGPLNLAGLAQSNAVLFILGTLGAGLLTTGMIYGGTREGYRRFCVVNYLLAGIVAALQAVVCLPGLSHFVFARVIGLTPAIEGPATLTLVASIPLQFLFFLRNPYQVVLYCNKATGRAGSATMFRIVLTLLLSPLFSLLGLVGPVWAVVCQTIPVGGEALVSWWFARRYLRSLPECGGNPPSLRELFGFAMPLSAGGFFLSASGLVLGAMIAHAANPERMLPAYYLAGGLAGPAAYAASRVQAVVLAFPPLAAGFGRVFRFSIAAGLVLGLLPLFFILPGSAEWYYVTLQQCRPDMLDLVRISALGLAVNPLMVAMRSYCEGLAALRKRPVIVLAGQAVFLGVMTSVSLACLGLGVAGNLIGPLAYVTANATAALVIYFALGWEQRTDGMMPVPGGEWRVASDS